MGQGRGFAGNGDHVLGRIQAGVPERVLDEGFVRQRFQRRTGFGNENEQGVLEVDVVQNGGGVVRVHVADEPSAHFKGAVLFRPIFQRQVHGAGAEVASANADLHRGGEFFTLGIGDLAGMYVSCEGGGLFLFSYVEFTLVDVVGDHVLAQLSAGQLMEHQALFPGVDHFAFVQGLIFFGELGFLRQRFQGVQGAVVHRFGGVMVGKALGHRHGVLAHALGAVFALHRFAQVHLAGFGAERLIAFQFVQVFPGDHSKPPFLFLNYSIWSIFFFSSSSLVSFFLIRCRALSMDLT